MSIDEMAVYTRTPGYKIEHKAENTARNHISIP